MLDIIFLPSEWPGFFEIQIYHTELIASLTHTDWPQSSGCLHTLSSTLSQRYFNGLSTVSKSKKKKKNELTSNLANALQSQLCLKSAHFIQMVYKRENSHVVAPQLLARTVDTWQDGATFMTNSCPAICMMRHKPGFMGPDGGASLLNHSLLVLTRRLRSSRCKMSCTVFLQVATCLL